MAPINRREFLAGVGGLGAGLTLGGVSHWLPLPPPQVGPDWAPGRERFVPSTCTLCPARCGIRGRVVDGNLVRIDGNPLHPVSRGGLCPKGAAGIQLLYHPGRITGPIERTGPPGSAEFQRITWEDAIQKITSALSELPEKKSPPAAVWLTGDVPGIMRGLIKRFASACGSSAVIREDYSDGSAEVMRVCQGVNSPPAFDLEASDYVLSFGAALSESWEALPLASAARAPADSPRPFWVQVDTRHSRTAARSDQWIAVRPGTYGVLALGIAYVILKEGLYDAEWISREVTGIEDWTDSAGTRVEGLRTLVLRHGRTETVADKTGVSAEEIVRLAKAFSSHSRPVAVWDHAVTWRTGGIADVMAIHALNVLVGAPGRPGGTLTQPPLPPSPVDEEFHGQPAGEGAESLTAANWAERIVSGNVPRALFLYYANPVASSPEPETAAKALDRVPFVVSFSPFLDETARHAHLVLPDHTYLERWQDAPSPASIPIPVWNVVQPMVEPLHDTRGTGDLILDIASRMGGKVAEELPWPSVKAMVEIKGKALVSARRGSAFVSEFRREELRELESRGWWLPHGMNEGRFWESILEAGGWFDPHYDYHDRTVRSGFADGKIRIFPPEARQWISSRVPGLPEGFLPDAGARRGEQDPALRLIPFRVMTLASGGTALMPWLLENLGVMTGDAWVTWAEINPETGRQLGLTSGQRVRIESPAGSFQARLRFFEGAQPGALNVPYGLHTAVEGWGDCEGDNPLRAVGNRRDPLTGTPDWYSTKVRVVPA